jgi:hypothetical protein
MQQETETVSATLTTSSKLTLGSATLKLKTAKQPSPSRSFKSTHSFLFFASEAQTIEKMRNFGSGLVQLGCKASNYTKISIYSTNRVEVGNNPNNQAFNCTLKP